MSAVDQLPGNLVHHGNPGRLVVHLGLQTLKPGQRGRKLHHEKHQCLNSDVQIWRVLSAEDPNRVSVSFIRPLVYVERKLFLSEYFCLFITVDIVQYRADRKLRDRAMMENRSLLKPETLLYMFSILNSHKDTMRLFLCLKTSNKQGSFDFWGC